MTRLFERDRLRIESHVDTDTGDDVLEICFPGQPRVIERYRRLFATDRLHTLEQQLLSERWSQLELPGNDKIGL